MKLVLIWILSTFYIVAISGLSCYDCFYTNAPIPGSQGKCEKKPKTEWVTDCDSYRPPFDIPLAGTNSTLDMAALFKNFGKPKDQIQGQSTKAKDEYYCFKFVGDAEGFKGVLRGCFKAANNFDYDQCLDDDDVTNGTSIPFKGKLCGCSSDNCNGSVYLRPTPVTIMLTTALFMVLSAIC